MGKPAEWHRMIVTHHALTSDMQGFPVEKLQPLPEDVFRGSRGLSIEIPLTPFTIDGSLIATVIHLDDVGLPTDDVLKFSGMTFSFPVNPEAGYIDGSIYIQHAQYPVDVTSMRFGQVADNAVEAEFEILFLFEFEGLCDYLNTPCTLHTRLRKSRGKPSVS